MRMGYGEFTLLHMSDGYYLNVGAIKMAISI